MVTLAIAYMIFAVSSTMFSSKKDLQEAAIIFPLLILILGAVYIFQIDIAGALTELSFLRDFIPFVITVNYYLIVSILIHICFIIIGRSLRFIIQQ